MGQEGQDHAGGPGAIGRAIGDGYERLVAVARRVLRDEDEARDTAQDACVSALRACETFAHRAQPSTWLHRITVNAALMRRRAQRRRREDPVDVQDVAPLASAWTTPSAEDVVARAQLRAVVQRAIASLPEQHRTVLELRDLRELDTSETAVELGLTPNAAKIRLHRARQALRAALTPLDPDAVHA